MTAPRRGEGAAKAYMSLDEVAAYFAISTKTVRRMIASQELSANRIGRLLRVPIADVKELEQRTSIRRWQ